MTEIDLPPRGSTRKHDWPGLARLLEEKPATWVMGPLVSAGTYSNAKYGRVAALRNLPGTVEIVSRDNETVAGVRTCRVWARYTPPGWTLSPRTASEKVP